MITDGEGQRLSSVKINFERIAIIRWRREDIYELSLQYF